MLAEDKWSEALGFVKVCCWLCFKYFQTALLPNAWYDMSNKYQLILNILVTCGPYWCFTNCFNIVTSSRVKAGQRGASERWKGEAGLSLTLQESHLAQAAGAHAKWHYLLSCVGLSELRTCVLSPFEPGFCVQSPAVPGVAHGRSYMWSPKSKGGYTRSQDSCLLNVLALQRWDQFLGTFSRLRALAITLC